MAFSIVSCEPDSIAMEETIIVSYGTICFCFPFTETKTIFQVNSISKSKIAASQDTADVVCDATLNGSEWNAIIQNLNIGEFVDIPEEIGCPNCLDEGAQWLKIATQHTSHKVTWSNNNELKQMQVLLNILQGSITKHFSQTDCR